jgi:hypothetical protein
MKPHAGRYIRDKVRVLCLIILLSLWIAGVPASIGILSLERPFIGLGSFLEPTSEIQCYSTFHMIPGIRDGSSIPGDGSRGKLLADDEVCLSLH